MSDERKIAQGPPAPVQAGQGLVVRTTSPVGTPTTIGGASQRVASAAGDRPMETLTSSRTVGGHTARLKVPEEEPLSKCPMNQVNVPVFDWDDPTSSSMPSPPAPMRAAGKAMPTLSTAPRSLDSPFDSPPKQVLAAPPEAPSAPTVREGRGPGIDWWTPTPVAVGLVCFAAGCMLGAAIDARIHTKEILAEVAERRAAVTALTASVPTATVSAAITAAVSAAPAPTVPATATSSASPRPSGAGPLSPPVPRVKPTPLPFGDDP